MNGVPARFKLVSVAATVARACNVRTWRDTIRIKAVALWQLFATSFGLVDDFLCLPCGPEPPTTLLVHLGSRCDTVDSKEEEFLRLDDREQVRNVGKDGEEDVFFRDAERGIVIVRVRAIVNDAIHVEVCKGSDRWVSSAYIQRPVVTREVGRTKGIELGNSVLLDELRNEWIALPVARCKSRVRDLTVVHRGARSSGGGTYDMKRKNW